MRNFLICCFLSFSYIHALTPLIVNEPGDANPTGQGISTGTTSGDLRYVLNYTNQNSDTFNINFELEAGEETITLGNILPLLNLVNSNTINIDGSNNSGDGSGVRITINGSNLYPGFFARQGTVSIQNLTVNQTRAKGGDGGVGGGGGGMGAGGALFIDQAAVSLSNVSFTNNTALGGNGGALGSSAHGGGGGMFGGNGGGISIQGPAGGGGGIGGNGGVYASPLPSGAGGGGGGGIGIGANGGLGSTTTLGGAGSPGIAFGATNGGTGNGGALGGTNGGGGGGGGVAGSPSSSAPPTPIFGGGGGGQYNPSGVRDGGNGGYGGGGGGAGGINCGSGSGGVGGFGGGGGSSGCNKLEPLNRSSGGFGGGGGGFAGIGGFGGGGGIGFGGTSPGGVGGGLGASNSDFGGGGMGAGGAVFINKGGSLTINGNFTTTGGTATGGVGGVSGSQTAAGVSTAIFSVTGPGSGTLSPLVFNPGAGATVTISGSIGDDNPNTIPGGSGVTAGTGPGVSITKNGSGTLVLSGTNTYAATTTINAGTLSISSSANLGRATNSIAIVNGTLFSTGSFTLSRAINLGGGSANFGADTGMTLTISSGITQSSASSFSKVGAGNVALTNSNAFTGGVTVQQGTLALSGSGAINAANPLVIAPTDGISATFDISGISASSVTVASLEGNEEGFLALGSRNLTFGSNNLDKEYAGTITGNSSSSLTKVGSGILTLSSASALYSGTTNLSAGGLRLAANNAIGTGALNMANGTAMYLDPGTSLPNNIGITNSAIIDIDSGVGTLTGVISGIGSVTKTGAGQLRLGSTNPYAGSTNLLEGILDLAASGAIGTGELEMTAGTELIIEDSVVISNDIGLAGSVDVTVFSSDTGTLSGAIDNQSGIGSITKLGGGTLVLSGDNGYNGLTTLSNGTLELTGAGKINSDLTIQNGTFDYSTIFASNLDLGAFDVGTSAAITNLDRNLTFVSGTFSGNTIFSGTGNVTKDGTGAFLLQPGKAFNVGSGNFTLTGGTNTINGTLTAVNMTNNSVLKGSGTVIASLTNQGTLSPGQSIGTFSITGDYIENGTYEVEITPSSNDLIQVTGNVTINPGSTLSVQPSYGSYVLGSEYTIIESGGTVSGTYTTLSNPFPLLDFTVLYETNAVKLRLSYNLFATVATTGNPAAVAAYIDTLIPTATGDLAFVIEQLRTLLSPVALIDALNQLHPAMFKALQITQQNNLSNIRGILSDRCFSFYQTDCDQKKTRAKTFSLWGNAFGDMNEQDEKKSQLLFGFQDNSGGILTGFDYAFNENFLIGFSSGYSYTDLKWDDQTGRGNINSGYLGLYTSLFNEDYFANASILSSYSRFEGKRYIDFAQINRTASHHNQGFGIDYHFDLGHIMHFSFLDLTAFGMVDYQSSQEQGFIEKGAQSLNLNVGKEKYNLLRGEAGFDFAKCISSQSGTKVIPDFKVSWIRELRFHSSHYTSHFVAQPGQFVVMGFNPSRTLFSSGVGVRAIGMQDRFSLGIRYDMKKSKNFFDQMLKFQASYNF